MALERKLLVVPLIAFTADGTALGIVTIADTSNFKDKQLVYIESDTILVKSYQIKRIISTTQLIVGPVNNSINPNDFLNVSAYKIINNARIGAVEQDKLAQPTDKDHYFAIYESSPVNADRVIGVDPYGNPWSEANPLPIEGTIVVTNGEPTKIEMQNIPIAIANTEFTIDLPDNTKRYQISVRDHKSKGRIAFMPTETVTNYRTHTRGTITDSYNLNLPINSKIYMQIDQVPAVIEVMIWTKP